MNDLIPYEVYAIRYATVERRADENFIGGDPHDSGMAMDYFIWVARNSIHSYVVDTGFNEKTAARRRRHYLRSPVESLRQLGIEAGEVKDLIITHLHYDHIGNFDLFPRARFHLQDGEMAFATGRYMSSSLFSQAYEQDEVSAMVRNVYAGRVSFYDGDATLAPGLSVHLIGGHTRGLQVVRIWTRVGWLVLASDASHYRRNLIEERPFPIVFDVGEMFDGWKRLRELAEGTENIIPGHDPVVMLEYQAPAPSMEGFVVRLDSKK